VEVKVVINGKEVKLVSKGQYLGFEKFTGSKEIAGLVALVYVRPDWDPETLKISNGSS